VTHLLGADSGHGLVASIGVVRGSVEPGSYSDHLSQCIGESASEGELEADLGTQIA
jgi:hypothetical protein